MFDLIKQNYFKLQSDTLKEFKSRRNFLVSMPFLTGSLLQQTLFLFLILQGFSHLFLRWILIGLHKIDFSYHFFKDFFKFLVFSRFLTFPLVFLFFFPFWQDKLKFFLGFIRVCVFSVIIICFYIKIMRNNC